MSDPQNPQSAPESGDPAPPPPPPGSEPPPPAPPLQYAGPVHADGGPLTADERTMGMLCHLASFAGHLIPFGNIIGPLVIWLIKKDQSAFVDDQGKEAMNFQITVTIAGLVSAALICLIVGYFLIFAVWIAAVVYVILAAVAANKGERYRYPFCLRLIQ